MATGLRWEALVEADYGAVSDLGDAAHPTLFERQEVLEQKMRLCPEGCRKLTDGTRLLGYGICHPYWLHAIPPLDTFLPPFERPADCLYIHDVVVDPSARGHGSAGRFVAHVRAVAARLALPALALVSVYGTHPMWARYGFAVVDDPVLAPKLASYGASARYMISRHG